MENIELRSEKTRRIIGEVPPRLVRIGTLILSLVMVCLAVAVCTIHYPITIEAEGVALNDSVIRVDVPFRYVHLMDEHRKANVIMEGDTESMHLPIIRHDKTLRTTRYGNAFSAYISIGKMSRKVRKGQQASVSIVVAKKTLVDFILKR